MHCSFIHYFSIPTTAIFTGLVKPYLILQNNTRLDFAVKVYHNGEHILTRATVNGLLQDLELVVELSEQ